MSSRNIRNSYRIAHHAGQQGAHRSVSTQSEVEKLDTRQKWTREDYIEVMFCYYKAKAEPSEGVTKDTFKMWSKRNPNERPDLTDNALMNQSRFIEKQSKLTGIELDNIKQRVENELVVRNNQSSSAADGVAVEETNSLMKLRRLELNGKTSGW